MSEHEKQVLTPEEVVARKGNAPVNSTEALYREAEAVIRAARRPTPHTNGVQSAHHATHDTADATPRA